jgi:hypothetical protein
MASRSRLRKVFDPQLYVAFQGHPLRLWIETRADKRRGKRGEDSSHFRVMMRRKRRIAFFILMARYSTTGIDGNVRETGNGTDP